MRVVNWSAPMRGWGIRFSLDAVSAVCQTDRDLGREAGLEGDDAARDLPLPHRLEGVVDPLERVGAADQLVQLELASQVQLDQLRHVQPEARASVGRAGEHLL